MHDTGHTDELQSSAIHTDPCDTPPIIESDLAESVVIGTEEPQELHISEFPTVPLVPPKREFHFNWWSVIALALLFILAGEHVPSLVISFVNTFLHPTATVTLFPTQKAMSFTYSFLAVTGTADPAQKQVSSRLLTFTTPSQTTTIKTTGTGYTPPIQAQGSLTFYNAAIYSQTIDAGTVITGSDGMQVVTDETVTVGAGNPPYSYGIAAASAHSIQAGTAGNIQPLAINGLCCVTGMSVKNTAAFSGGEDLQSYPTLSQSDVDAATKQIGTTLDPQARDVLTADVQTTEQLFTPLNCTYQTTATPKVGEKATTATVSVSETCNVQVYDYKALQTLTRSEFLQDVATQAGADFIPKGTVSIAIEKATLLDKSHQTYSLAVSAKGSLIFHLTQARLHDLSTQIAGKSLSQAQKHLLQLQGVQGVYIQPAGNTDTSLPADPSQIAIQITTGS